LFPLDSSLFILIPVHLGTDWALLFPGHTWPADGGHETAALLTIDRDFLDADDGCAESDASPVSVLKVTA